MMYSFSALQIKLKDTSAFNVFVLYFFCLFHFIFKITDLITYSRNFHWIHSHVFFSTIILQMLRNKILRLIRIEPSFII